MFSKRTRLYTNFKLINFFQVIKSLLFKDISFEKELRGFLNKKNIKLTSLGRTALYDIVKIIIKETNKKKFFIAPYTIPAVVHAIYYAGGEVVFIDIDKGTGLIDEKKLQEKMCENSAGVIITHLYSNSKNIKNFINNFKGKIKIIEDAAINFGSKLDENYLGTLADYGFYSFNIVKNLNTLNGGAIYIKDDYIFEKYIKNRKVKKFPLKMTFNLMVTALIIKLMFNNITYQFFHYFLRLVYKKKIRFILKKIYPILYHTYEKQIPEIYFLDFNWIMNDVGVYNLKKINKNYEERLKKAKMFYNLIDKNVATKSDCFLKENSLLEYPIILKNIDNQTAHSLLMEQGYDVRHTWYINNLQKENNKTDYTDTFFLEKKIFCLPIHKNISENDIRKISKIINKFT